MAIGKISFLLLIVSVSLTSDVFWRITKILQLNEYFLSPTTEVNKQKKLLVVGVMSAQHHFKERESIRNTWGQLIEPDGDLKFLLGSEICPIPPKDRITPYICEKWSLNISASLNLSTIDLLMNPENLLEGHSGFTFMVKHNITVVKLGVHSLIFKNGECKRARVFLFDAASGEKLASATFIGENYSSTVFMWKSIQAIKLPQGFEGELQLVTEKHLNITCPKNILNNGVIHIFEIFEKDMYVKFKESSCMLVALTYNIENYQELITFVQEEPMRKNDWESKTEILKHQLEIEKQAYNDLLYFDFVDVYKNLTLKLYNFLNWTQEINGYKYILKTDDDVFLDVKRIVYVLKLHLSDDWDWWSCFRQNCPPPRFGKWRDRLFGKKQYPPFPSGAGYVITNDIASLVISENVDESITAGEDVSLAVWIYKSLKRYPKKLNTSFAYWACGILCSPVHPCNVPQLRWQQLHQTMQRLLLSEPICEV